MLLTIGTNLAWVVFLLIWGIVLMSETRSYAAQMDAVEIDDEVTDSNI